MSDLLTELVRKLGYWIVPVTFLFLIVVWTFAHWTAQPGQKISLFWGMIEYTKSENSNRDLQSPPEPLTSMKSEQNVPMQSNKDGSRTDCLNEYFRDLPPDRISTLEEGSREYVVIGEQQSKEGGIGLKFTENGEPIGAIRFNFFTNGTVFKIDEIVNALCRRISGQKAQSQVIQNWNTVEIQLDKHNYVLGFEYDAGRIRVSQFVKASP